MRLILVIGVIAIVSIVLLTLIQHSPPFTPSPSPSTTTTIAGSLHIDGEFLLREAYYTRCIDEYNVHVERYYIVVLKVLFRNGHDRSIIVRNITVDNRPLLNFTVIGLRPGEETVAYFVVVAYPWHISDFFKTHIYTTDKEWRVGSTHRVYVQYSIAPNMEMSTNTWLKVTRIIEGG